jgi:hypothetical protein
VTAQAFAHGEGKKWKTMDTIVVVTLICIFGPPLALFLLMAGAILLAYLVDKLTL